MAIRRLLLAAFGALLIAVFGGTTAQAQGWGGYGYGYGYYPRAYNDFDRVPYFALHPPVRYSYQVARPYGYSPFAYPPTVMTPAAEPPQPMMVDNPYSPSKVASNQDAVPTGPLVVTNPYVKKK